MQLHFQSFGSGFPLIILHGLFGSSDNWQSLSKRLGQDFQVFALDLRNHGKSPHADESNYVVISEDLRQFFREHKIERAHVLGHSMGGKVAMQFALTFGELVNKLIVVDIAPKSYPRHHDYIFEALRGVDLVKFTTRSAVEQAIAPKIPDTATRHFLLKSIGQDKHGSLRWKINLPALERHYDEITAAPPAKGIFDRPALFIRGERSNYIEPSDEMTIRELFPDTTLVTIPAADHWVHADAPHHFLEAVLSFLKR